MFGKTPLLVSATLAAVLLAACGGSAASAPGGRTAPLAAGAPNTASLPKQQAAESGGAAASGAAAPAAVPSLPPPQGPRVQLSAKIALEVPNGRFDAVLDDVIAVATAAGGYISGQNAQAAGQDQPLRSGQVTFQVPARSFEAVVAGMRKQGRAQSIAISGNDVSAQYVDLQARLRNEEAQRDAMLALMQQARSVNDTIQIENQLGQITGQIEQLRGQIDFLNQSTTYSTVAVSITEQAAAASADEWGLATAASQAIHNLVGVVDFLIVAAGTLLPLLAVGAGLVLAWRLAWRRTRPAGVGREPARATLQGE
jgi:hypothetical protein